ncbi:MAG TPA: hypothetical protein VM733_06030 [Thermoanaerobaculia bacterium]|nr:hypothetical protein [Thermoanaerobaculia bacterium]
MRTTRVFRWIWRLNALAILAGAIAILVLILSEVKPWRRDTPVVPAVVVPQPPSPEVKLRLSDPALIPGTHLLAAEMQSIQEGRGLKEGDVVRTRNVLFIDPTTGASRWLLPSHQSVLSETAIHAPDDAYERGTPIALAVYVTNEGAATGELFVRDAIGSRLVPVATGVSRVHSATAANASEFIVLFERNQRFVMARFSNATLEKLSEHELKLPPI